ncbi:hypothetical protein Agub_g12161 [Astrephomene gubernaculifera]|uniref:Uncharacterized protein n=1 Tax=Astrephomene gubernaculifera TaxID=47775 RepID=A0AAD3DZD1_9CHLO|nr:hypothetical protein Agub_g12161 [Astrephomene gubernaculifera]
MLSSGEGQLKEKSVLNKLFGGIQAAIGARKKGSFGEDNAFYYHPKLQRWVERGKEGEAAKESELPPPPMTNCGLGGATPKKRSLAERYKLQDNLRVSKSTAGSHGQVTQPHTSPPSVPFPPPPLVLPFHDNSGMHLATFSCVDYDSLPSSGPPSASSECSAGSAGSSSSSTASTRSDSATSFGSSAASSRNSSSSSSASTHSASSSKRSSEAGSGEDGKAEDCSQDVSSPSSQDSQGSFALLEGALAERFVSASGPHQQCGGVRVTASTSLEAPAAAEEQGGAAGVAAAVHGFVDERIWMGAVEGSSSGGKRLEDVLGFVGSGDSRVGAAQVAVNYGVSVQHATAAAAAGFTAAGTTVGGMGMAEDDLKENGPSLASPATVVLQEGAVVEYFEALASAVPDADILEAAAQEVSGAATRGADDAIGGSGDFCALSRFSSMSLSFSDLPCCGLGDTAEGWEREQQPHQAEQARVAGSLQGQESLETQACSNPTGTGSGLSFPACEEFSFTFAPRMVEPAPTPKLGAGWRSGKTAATHMQSAAASQPLAADDTVPSHDPPLSKNATQQGATQPTTRSSTASMRLPGCKAAPGGSFNSNTSSGRNVDPAAVDSALQVLKQLRGSLLLAGAAPGRHSAQEDEGPGGRPASGNGGSSCGGTHTAAAEVAAGGSLSASIAQAAQALAGIGLLPQAPGRGRSAAGSGPPVDKRCNKSGADDVGSGNKGIAGMHVVKDGSRGSSDDSRVVDQQRADGLEPRTLQLDAALQLTKARDRGPGLAGDVLELPDTGSAAADQLPNTRTAADEQRHLSMAVAEASSPVAAGSLSQLCVSGGACRATAATRTSSHGTPTAKPAPIAGALSAASAARTAGQLLRSGHPPLLRQRKKSQKKVLVALPVRVRPGCTTLQGRLSAACSGQVAMARDVAALLYRHTALRRRFAVLRAERGSLAQQLAQERAQHKAVAQQLERMALHGHGKSDLLETDARAAAAGRGEVSSARHTRGEYDEQVLSSTAPDELTAAAAAEAAVREAQELRSQLDELLLCLGQESSKVQLLAQALRERGGDPEHIIEQVEAEYETMS